MWHAIKGRMNKKYLFATALLVLLNSPLALAIDSTIKLKTITGEEVEVMTTELVKALNGTRNASQNFEHATVNDDGSISLLKPRVKFSGYNYPIAYRGYYRDDGSSSADGICRLYGFKTASAAPIYNRNTSTITYAVVVSKDGNVERLVDTTTEIRSITCRE